MENELIATVAYDDSFDDWYLDLGETQLYSYDLLEEINKLLGRPVEDGERFKIVITKI